MNLSNILAYMARLFRAWFGCFTLLRLGMVGRSLCASSLLWRHNGRDGVSNHQPHDYLVNRLFRCWSKKTSKLRVTVLCAGYSLVTGEFSAHMASNAEMAFYLMTSSCMLSSKHSNVDFGLLRFFSDPVSTLFGTHLRNILCHFSCLAQFRNEYQTSFESGYEGSTVV